MQVMALLGFRSIITVLLKNPYAQRAITPVKTLLLFYAASTPVVHPSVYFRSHFLVLVRKLLIYESILFVACN